jgi:hypothetical protein
MGDLLGEGDALAAKDTLYRCLDLLLEHKRALFDRTGCGNITTAGNSLIKYGGNFDSKIPFLLILTAFCESVWLFYRTFRFNCPWLKPRAKSFSPFGAMQPDRLN